VSLRIKLLLLLRRLLLLSLGESLLALGGLACWGRSTIKGIVRLCVGGGLLRYLTRVRCVEGRRRVSGLRGGCRGVEGLLGGSRRGSNPARSIGVTARCIGPVVVGSGSNVWGILAGRVHGTRLCRRGIPSIRRRRRLLRLLEAAVGTTGLGVARLLLLLRRRVGTGGTCVTGGTGSWVSGAIIGRFTSIGVLVVVVGRAVVLARLVRL
jgi:hypothetical protein